MDTKTAKQTFWDNIDAVCVINLDHRTDRWEAIRNELSFLPENKLIRVSACWGKKLPTCGKGMLFRGCTQEETMFWAGRAGCVLSHTKCLQMAKDNAWRNVMILEDDASFVDDLRGNVGEMLLQVMEGCPDWNMIFPGLAPYDSQGVKLGETMTESGEKVRCYRILGPLNAHCYIVSAQTVNMMLNYLPRENDIWRWLAFHLSYDSWIANDFGKKKEVLIAGLYPIVCVQRESASDIELIVRSSGGGRLGAKPFPIAEVSEREFRNRYHSFGFIRKKMLKLLVHRCLGLMYYLIGFRRFQVSIANAGYWGALKAALRVLRNRA